MSWWRFQGVPIPWRSCGSLVLLSSEYELRLTTAHLNHGLRGAEAQREEEFVKDLCAGMGIVCICKTVDIRMLQKGSGNVT